MVLRSLYKDGKPDLIYLFKNKNATIAESAENDMNFDGKFDVIIRFDSEGMAVSGGCRAVVRSTKATGATYEIRLHPAQYCFS